MSELRTLCDQVRQCTKRTIEEIRKQDPDVAALAKLLETRAAHFSSIEALANESDVEHLTQLSSDIQLLDAELLEWMQTAQQSLAISLTKVRNSTSAKRSSSPQPRILIQSA